METNTLYARDPGEAQHASINRPPNALQPDTTQLTATALDASDAPAPGESVDSATRELPGLIAQKEKSSGEIQTLLTINFELIQDRNGTAFMVVREGGNPLVLRLTSEEARGLITRELRRSGARVTPKVVSEVIEELKVRAVMSGKRVDVWSRIAQLPDGTRMIALNDEANAQVRISPGNVEVVTSGSPVLFCRSPASAPMVMPAPVGNCRLLKKYLNLQPKPFLLYIAWVTYTLAMAKQPGNVFVILQLLGGQGTGKSMISKVSIQLVDPNVIGVSRMPTSVKDLAVAAQHSHLLAYDNLRELRLDMSDALCTMSTRGSVSSRRLYSDDQQQVLPLHGPALLNGIHAFVDQPDLAHRCLPLRLDPMDESKRASEANLLQQFETDLPVIQRGLFDLIAKILQHLPAAQVTHPQRMLAFCQWLAAFELADGHPGPGLYQELYAELLNEGQLDSIRDNVVGSAVLDFARQVGGGEWSGTPKELLKALDSFMVFGFQRPPRGWPDNEIALSKRLSPLIAALRTQGVQVTFERRKERTIFIKLLGASGRAAATDY